MKLLVFLGALAIVGLVITGAIHLQKTSNNTITIEIDKARVKDDADALISKGEGVLHDVEENLQSRAPDAARN